MIVADEVVEGWMSPVPVRIDRGASVADAGRRMFANDIRHLLVFDGLDLAGILSQRDVAVYEVMDGGDREGTPVGRIMSERLYVCAPQTPMADVVRTMLEERIGAAVVMDGGEVCGIVTQVDALRLLGRVLDSGKATPLPQHI